MSYTLINNIANEITTEIVAKLRLESQQCPQHRQAIYDAIKKRIDVAGVYREMDMALVSKMKSEQLASYVRQQEQELCQRLGSFLLENEEARSREIFRHEYAMKTTYRVMILKPTVRDQEGIL